MKKTAIFVIVAFIIFVAGIFLIKTKLLNNPNINKPKQEIGEVVEDKGRDHVDDISGVQYSSNPPTSGPHFPVWAKPGVYDRLISDGYLLHSMEHGYIVIWYNCDKLVTSYKLIPEVLAHDEGPVATSAPDTKIQPLMHMNFEVKGDTSWFTPETQPAAEVQLPLSFTTPACKNFVEQLKPFLKTEQRVIIAPRVNMDKKLVITAWDRLLKLDTVDTDKINLFIRTYHNQGPEQTME